MEYNYYKEKKKADEMAHLTLKDFQLFHHYIYRNFF